MTSVIEDMALDVRFLRSTQVDLMLASEELFDVILLTPKFEEKDKDIPFKNESTSEKLQADLLWIDAAAKRLSKDGTMLIYNIPRWLPYYATHIDASMTFKYWISIKNPRTRSSNFVQTFHEGVLLYVKNPRNFTINRVRYPHIFCSQCGDYLADWGGKKHLRPKDGPVVSDVWDDRDDFIDDLHGLAPHTLERLLNLTCKPGFKVLIGMYDGEPYDGTKLLEVDNTSLSNKKDQIPDPLQRHSIGVTSNFSTSEKGDFRPDDIFIGDCVEVMSSWVHNPEARFDLIFADPPYNLEKDYGKIDDDLKSQEYIEWCNNWLDLCAKLLKPNGTLYVLNLPKWTVHHAVFLNQRLYFQRWIVWDALSDPRGKIMPAHYGLLVYTADPLNFTYNLKKPIPKADQCFRAKCISKRSPNAPKEELSDIWYDVHRIKHKRDRDAHPCQLPVKLLERIISISSSPGDLVLDPFMGTGTTAFVAHKLGRHFAGIDIDMQYREIAIRRLRESDESLGENKYAPDLPKIPSPRGRKSYSQDSFFAELNK